eukprot:COSAG06_NODE_1693_length_8701_cov_80.626133_8_plen_247_part_00
MNFLSGVGWIRHGCAHRGRHVRSRLVGGHSASGAPGEKTPFFGAVLFVYQDSLATHIGRLQNKEAFFAGRRSGRGTDWTHPVERGAVDIVRSTATDSFLDCFLNVSISDDIIFVVFWQSRWQGGLGQVRKTVLFVRFYIKMLILPRQARDKHRENSHKTGDWGSLGSASGQGTDGINSSDGAGAAAPAPQEQVRKRRFFAPFYIKMLILPRQARDKHRKSTQKSADFLQDGGGSSSGGTFAMQNSI